MAGDRGFEVVVSDVVGLLEAARSASARSVNSILTSTYWAIGQRIVEEEQRGGARAEHYGQEVVEHLAAALASRFGRGFGRRNLFLMRSFFVAYRGRLQTSTKRTRRKNVQSPIAQSFARSAPSAVFPLPWTHYVRLLHVHDPEARDFYEAEALRGGWTVRQLERQIATDFFGRARRSRRKSAASTLPRIADGEIKDPYVLEFLGLDDKHSESEFEDGLIRQLQSFLLELGGDFAFVGRQQRMRVGDQWYRVDLLFFHRGLRCLVIIDLKVGALTAADAGQMHLYLNYARANWMRPGENPPVGLILSGKKNAVVAHYALDGLRNKVLAAEYRTALPAEEVLVDRINRGLKLLEGRRK